MIKVTFTLDEEPAAYLDRTAERLRMPKSRVVREAIRIYGEQAGRLSNEERTRLLDSFDEVPARIGNRPRAEVEQELDDLRTARKGVGRGGHGLR